MKRKVASRRLKRTCICCNKSFSKGDVYYVTRNVFEEFGGVFASEFITCARCNYYESKHKLRYENFVSSGNCSHPFKDEVWRLMSGEDVVKEPSHTECWVCKKVI